MHQWDVIAYRSRKSRSNPGAIFLNELRPAYTSRRNEGRDVGVKKGGPTRLEIRFIESSVRERAVVTLEVGLADEATRIILTRRLTIPSLLPRGIKQMNADRWT